MWSLDADRAPIVREMFERVTAGESCLAIARDLHERGIPRPRGTWSRARVYVIVRSRHPVGEWSPDKKAHALIRVPAIIDEALWHKAQAKLSEHGKRGLIKAKHTYLLQGLGVCHKCGQPMTVRSPTKQRRGRVQAAAYLCRARKFEEVGRARCDSAITRTSDIDERVWSAVTKALLSDELVERVAERDAQRDANASRWFEDVRGYEARLKQIETASAAIAARFRRGLLSEAVFDGELDAAAKDRAAIATQLETARAALRGHVGPSVDAQRWVDAIRDLAVDASPEERQAIVRKFVEPGGAVFIGGLVELTLRFTEPARAASLDEVGTRRGGLRLAPATSAG
ncbi:MAG TPA: recombinase family protein [Kofleriaceae bacterium]